MLSPLFSTAASVPSSESVMNSARLTWPEMVKSTACAASGAARAPAIATVSALSRLNDSAFPFSQHNKLIIKNVSDLRGRLATGGSVGRKRSASATWVTPCVPGLRSRGRADRGRCAYESTPPLEATHPDVGGDAAGDPRGGRLHRISGKMSIAGGGVYLAVSEQPADHRQALAEGERPRRERVPEVVNASVLETGPRPDPQPVVIEVRQAPSRPRTRDHPRIAGDPGKTGQHRARGRRERHHPRPRLAVAQLEPARPQVDVFPLQVQDLVPAAAGQHQQPERRNRRCLDRRPSPLPGPGLDVVQDPPEPAELLLRQKPLPLVLLVLADGASRVRPCLPQAPHLGQGEHLVQDVEHLVRPVRGPAKAVVQRRDVLALDRSHRHVAERRQDPPGEGAPVGTQGRWLAAHRHVLGEEPLREHGDGDRRPEFAIRSRPSGQRIFSRLEAGDDERRPPAGLSGGEHPVPGHRDSSRPASRSGLDDIDLGPRRIDPDPEPEKLAVPEDGVPVRDGKALDRASGDAQAGHVPAPRRVSRAVYPSGGLPAPSREGRRPASDGAAGVGRAAGDGSTAGGGGG